MRIRFPLFALDGRDSQTCPGLTHAVVRASADYRRDGAVNRHALATLIRPLIEVNKSGFYELELTEEELAIETEWGRQVGVFLEISAAGAHPYIVSFQPLARKQQRTGFTAHDRLGYSHEAVFHRLDTVVMQNDDEMIDRSFQMLADALKDGD